MEIFISKKWVFLSSWFGARWLIQLQHLEHFYQNWQYIRNPNTHAVFLVAYISVQVWISTHNSMITKSVTHLRSYTNTAIAGNSAPISPKTPREPQYHQDERDVAVPSQFSALSADIIAFEWQVFHGVSQCFKSVPCFTSGSWCFTSGSRCFTMFHDISHFFTSVSWCFTMFNNVLRYLVSRATIGITAWPPIASGIATTMQGLAITPQGSSISPRKWSHAKLHPKWRLKNSVPGRQFPKGFQFRQTWKKYPYLKD